MRFLREAGLTIELSLAWLVGGSADGLDPMGAITGWSRGIFRLAAIAARPSEISGSMRAAVAGRRPRLRIGRGDR